MPDQTRSAANLDDIPNVRYTQHDDGTSTLQTISSGGGGGGPATIADGADVTQGALADAAVTTDTGGTLSGKLRGLVKWAYERMPVSLGQKAKAASLAVTLASDQDALGSTVANGANVALGNTGDAAVTSNTTGTAIGFLRGLVTLVAARIPILGQAVKASSVPVTLASNQDALPITDNAGSLTTDTPQLPAALGQTTSAQSLSVVFASDGSVSVRSISGAVTDRSGSITTGGTSQPVMSSVTSRRYFVFMNISDTDMWIRWGAAAAPGGQGSYLIKANGGNWTESGTFVPNQSLNVYCATTGKVYSAGEF